MKTAILRFFGFSGKQGSFADFFRGSPTKDKENLIRTIVRESNKDQRDLIKKYEILTKTTR